jgi:hypothetical protein
LPVLTSLAVAVAVLQVWAGISKPVQATSSATNDTIENDTNKDDTNTDDTSPAAESPQMAPKPMATPAAAAATVSDDTKGLQDNNTPSQATATGAAAAPTISNESQGLEDSTAPSHATATATVTLRRPKAAPKPLQDYSLLAPPHIRQLEQEYCRKEKQHMDALRACRLQFTDCRWYEQIYN